MSEPQHLAKARTYVGYRSQPFRDSTYGKKYGYGGSPWGGMFLDYILESTGLREVSLVSTVTALSYYVRRNRLKLKPKPGDIVFLNHSERPWEQPQVGLVISTAGWRVNGHVLTVEGETRTGSPKGSQEADGIFERHRYETDIIGFVTPRPPKTVKPKADGPILRTSFLTSNPTTKANATARIQQALFDLTGQTNFDQGKLDPHTRSALAKWNRERGAILTDGTPDDKTLKQLGETSGVFTWDR